MNLLKNKTQIFLTVIFLGYVAWWASFQSIVNDQGTSVQWFGGTYGLVALFGSVVGFIAAKKWGGFKTVLGKALMLFSFGLLSQELGQLISTYYVYGAKVEQLPYPSIGDVAYFGSALLYICAAMQLAKMTGVKFALKKSTYKVIAAVVPVLILLVSYTVLLRGYEFDTSKPLTVFLDAGYPIVQALYISIAVVAYLLSRKLMGGIMKAGFILVALGLTIQYASDFGFIYQSHKSSYVPGKYVDLLYLTAYFVLSTAMVRFLSIYNKLRVSSNSTANPKSTSGVSSDVRTTADGEQE